jgi:hypothetical protein
MGKVPIDPATLDCAPWLDVLALHMDSDLPTIDSSLPPPGPLQLCTAAGFDFPVFISWPHLIRDRGAEIVRALSAALENRFRDEGGAKVFLDVARIKPGFRWEDVVRGSLCRSVVTVVFLVRTYFDSEYCRIEWAISEKLAELRLNRATQRSTIIPISLTRNLLLPKEVSSLQFDSEFQELLVYGRDVTQHEKWNQLVDELAQLIYELIEEVCVGERDWPREEEIARTTGPKRFSWREAQGSGAPRPKPLFPKLSVEKPAA